MNVNTLGRLASRTWLYLFGLILFVFLLYLSGPRPSSEQLSTGQSEPIQPLPPLLAIPLLVVMLFMAMKKLRPYFGICALLSFIFGTLGVAAWKVLGLYYGNEDVRSSAQSLLFAMILAVVMTLSRLLVAVAERRHWGVRGKGSALGKGIP